MSCLPQSLLLLPPHEHIIPLYDVFLPPTTRELHIVFECMEGNLYQLTKTRKGRPLASGLVASILQQVLAGLHHVHTHGFFHRDLKPENLLITTTGLGDYPSSPHGDPHAPVDQDVLVVVKIADFGLAREITSAPPYTEYVSTRWYRAPEVLLHAAHYSPAVDVWALGAILAELVMLEPLFPGTNEMDQALRITAILGTPLRASAHDAVGPVLRGGGVWPGAALLCGPLGFRFPDKDGVPFAPLFPAHVPRRLIHLIFHMLRYDPAARLTPEACLQHAFVQSDAPLLRPRAKYMPHALGADPGAAPARVPAEEPAARRGAAHLHEQLRSALDLHAHPAPLPHDAAPTSLPPSRRHERTMLASPSRTTPASQSASPSGSPAGTPARAREARVHLRERSMDDSTFARPTHAIHERPKSEGVSKAAAHARGDASAAPSGFLSSWMHRKSHGGPRQSKEEQLKRREAELLAMRSRSRAVLQKRSQLLADERRSSGI